MGISATSHTYKFNITGPVNTSELINQLSKADDAVTGSDSALQSETYFEVHKGMDQREQDYVAVRVSCK